MRRAFLAVLALAGTIALSACQGADEGGPVTIVSAQWQQHQAIENFDSEPGETTDAGELARLAEIVETHGLQGEDLTSGDACPGGRSTLLTYATDGGEEYTIEVQGCDRDDAGDAIDELVSEWRTSR